MGTLERLQNSAFEYLRSVADLSYADIKKNGSPDLGGKAEGLRIDIMRPLPLAASKYAAGPTFSEVELRIRIVRDDDIAARAPSLLTSAEIVSRAMHNWLPPASCGYGRTTLAQQRPWAFGKNSDVEIILKAQSVLQ